MNDTRPPRIYKIAIMILPLGVIIGTIVFMWMYYAKHKDGEKEQNVIVASGIRISELEDMVGKFTELIGERTIETEEGRAGLRRAAAMIEGRLGPQNLGMKVMKGKGFEADGLLWKSLWVDIRGEDDEQEVVIAAVSFAGSGDVADANTASTMMMVASSLAEEKPGRTIRVVFLPINLPPGDQNIWLKEYCLQEGESCVGIVGLQLMESEPTAGGAEWIARAPAAADGMWWAYLSGSSQEKPSVGGEVPSVWLTHAVYSTEAWQDKKELRLRSTIKVAQQLRDWLLKAAE